MFFRQYQLACLSLFSYLVADESTGRAVVVDPQRDIAQYLADAEANGLTIERVIETHFHADFLSGHLELAEATGAAISYGDEASAEFPIEPLAHLERLALGDVTLEIRHTPGHTPESISIVVYPTPDAEPWAVLTGDTLFVGDVGRPDLLASLGWTADDLARRLFRSLHDQLLTLPDATLVYPAHGAGSACGKSMTDAVSSTISEQRETNYALQPMSEDSFVEAVTQGQSVAPLYFAFAADANRRDRPLLDDQEPPVDLSLEDVDGLVHAGAVIIDARSPEAFASGHLSGSINVGLDGRFAEYAGDIARPGDPIVIVADGGRQTEAKVRLARVGFDRVEGAVTDVERLLAAYPERAGRSLRLPVTDLAEWMDDDPPPQLLDIRNPAEQEEGVIPGSLLLPLARLLEGHVELDPERPTLVYCAGGYRSSAAASFLRANGFDRAADVLGGFDAWKDAGFPLEPASDPLA